MQAKAACRATLKAGRNDQILCSEAMENFPFSRGLQSRRGSVEESDDVLMLPVLSALHF